jgi:putative transposase
VNEISDLTALPVRGVLRWAQLHNGRFYCWRERDGEFNEHNGEIPRDHWLCSWENDSVLEFKDSCPLNGYRR